MGRTIQQWYKTGGLHSQPQVLSVWLHRELLDGALSVAETDDLLVGEVGFDRQTSVLQREMTHTKSSVSLWFIRGNRNPKRFFGVFFC